MAFYIPIPFHPFPTWSISIPSHSIPNFLTNSHSHGIPTGLFPFFPIPIPKQSFNRSGVNIFDVSKTRLTYNIIVLSLSLNLTVSIKWSRITYCHQTQK